MFRWAKADVNHTSSKERLLKPRCVRGSVLNQGVIMGTSPLWWQVDLQDLRE